MKNRNLVIVFVLTLCAIFKPVCAAEEETYTGPTYAELRAKNTIQDGEPDARGGFVPGYVYGNLRITADGRLQGLELLEERLQATRNAMFQPQVKFANKR